MRVVIAGPRPPMDIRLFPLAVEAWYGEHYHLVPEAVAASGFEITEEVCGKAPGFDTLGERWAFRNGIPVKPFWAKWGEQGKAAGAIRNAKMGDYADALIALVADPPTPGTSNMVAYMKSVGKPVYEHPIT